MLTLRLMEEGANTDLTWLLLVGLAFFVLIVIVGWLVSRQQGQPATASASKPRKSTTSQGGDDLTILEGVGPKVAKVLNRAGILTFEDLARADAGWVQTTLDAAKLQMLNPEGWIAQAKLAAKGDKSGLVKLQEELKGGRRAG
jgi:hypothetical protein